MKRLSKSLSLFLIATAGRTANSSSTKAVSSAPFGCAPLVPPHRPNERAVIIAVALHSGDTWTIVLLEGTQPTIEKRGAQIHLVTESLRDKGYQRESFAGCKALPLTTERVEELKNFFETMTKLGVPGASLALIENGKVVYEGGLKVDIF